mmetsp:Transcript_4376/g.7469  ORF Transcript_4376/g.7469 Transcript_4376/m.7469 type:complete len:669 (-) Transcript_4376:237-2243(-)
MDENNSYLIPAKVLGRNWVECTDTVRNRIYYANLETKETRWDFPDALLSDHELVNHSEHWIEAMDIRRHKKYYYNRVSKEAVWEQPECLVVLPSHVMVGTTVTSTAPAVKGSKKAKMLSVLNDMKTESEIEKAAMISNEAKNSSAKVKNIVSVDNDEQSYVEQLLHAVAISTEELYAMSSPDRSLVNYGKLNFATSKSGIFKRKISVEKMLEWSNKGIMNPLHNMQGEMMTEAIQFSKNIRGFMGDRASTKNLMEHADKIIKVLLLSSQELRDELFCQLCKQLNKNPSRTSSIRGWQLFLICLTSAAPNNELMISLIDFFKQFIEGKDREISCFAKETLHKCYISTQMHGSRVERPNSVEVASIMSANPMQIRIWFLDGVYITVKCDSWMVVSELELIIAQELGIMAPKYFGLYEALATGEERLLNYDDRVLDLVAQWKRFQSDDVVGIEFIKFVYKVRYFVPIEDETDTSSIEMMYIQGVHDVLNMVDLCKNEDAFDLAALQLHDKLGSHDDKRTLRYLHREVEKYIPSRVFDMVERDVIISTVSSRYAELDGYTSLEARLEYLQIIREFPSYGSSYFLVTCSGLLSKGSKEVVVSITPKGLFIIDNYSKEFIKKYLFEDILTWGHSPTQFILATGTVTNKKTVSFKCTSGKEMNDMMSVYVACLRD